MGALFRPLRFACNVIALGPVVLGPLWQAPTPNVYASKTIAIDNALVAMRMWNPVAIVLHLDYNLLFFLHCSHFLLLIQYHFYCAASNSIHSLTTFLLIVAGRPLSLSSPLTQSHCHDRTLDGIKSLFPILTPSLLRHPRTISFNLDSHCIYTPCSDAFRASAANIHQHTSTAHTTTTSPCIHNT